VDAVEIFIGGETRTGVVTRRVFTPG